MSRRPIVVGAPDPMLEALRRRSTWALVAVGAIVGGALGVVWMLLTPVSFTATVALEVNLASPQVNISDIGPRPQTISMDTDAQLVTSDAVVAVVADTTGQGTDQVRENIEVAARPLTQIMTISYTARNPKDATEGATAAADAFLDERERLIVEPVSTYLSASSTEGLTDDTFGDIFDDPSPDPSSLAPWRQSAVVKLAKLGEAGRIQEGARLTATNDRGDIEMPIATGVALGILLALGVSALRQQHSMRRARGQVSSR
jgi:hypothetical protein